MSQARTRLDQALVERGLYESREKARRAVMAGQVLVDGQPATKPGQSIKKDHELELKEKERFVSRGGHKLDHAIEAFGLSVAGLIAADLGASTGGFTDCLLQRDVRRVHAIDVGMGQLAWKLRQDKRVRVMEKTNARHLKSDSLPEMMDLVVIDCSFISLRQILPAAQALLRPGGDIIALIKPQFEAGKEIVDRGKGVVRDPAIHESILKSLKVFVDQSLAMDWIDHTTSPILGPAGNREFLVRLQKHATRDDSDRADRQP
jgi:23S rRNA (cytidine1920-2'-O)/16S rRNA (cytidine1409-2'-O)-methyltransferase